MLSVVSLKCSNFESLYWGSKRVRYKGVGDNVIKRELVYPYLSEVRILLL